MAQEQLLKYQQEDSKLLELEREAANSEERKNYSQAKAFLTKAPEKLDGLEAKAVELTRLVDQLNKQYAEIAETLKDFESIDELALGGAEISFYKKNVLQIAEQLKNIRAEVNSLTKSIKDADEEYRNLKKKTISMQKQYAEYTEVYKAYKEKKLAEMEAVKTELAKLAKGIDPAVMQKYQSKRSERIFPILCAVKDGRCSKCGTELSLSGKEKINSGDVIECDNCHRFLYKD
ncbi:MAG: hypothetical protein HDP34_05060 [Clostridia bacterium]|nr:hypothetical protein [Clostridia bacterium]